LDIKKAFYVELDNCGITRIYNVNDRFFSWKETSGDNDGLITRFDPSQEAEKNEYIRKLIKEGWFKLSREEINSTRLDEYGNVSAYPFEYAEGVMYIGIFEDLAKDMQYKWDYKDHDTNPFSAKKDYAYFLYNICMTNLTQKAKHDTEPLEKALEQFKQRLSDIGAMEQIEDYFTKERYTPDPRRFDDNFYQLIEYYHSHINECCRAKCLGFFNNKSDLDSLIMSLQELKSLQQLAADKWYEMERRMSSVSEFAVISADPYK